MTKPDIHTTAALPAAEPRRLLRWAIVLLLLLPTAVSASEVYLRVHDGPERELNWASLDRDKLSGDRRLAAFTTNTGMQRVSVVRDPDGKQYLRAEIDGKTRELNWASLDKDRLSGDRRLAAWTVNLGNQPIEIVTEDGRSFVRAEIDGRFRELSWASLHSERLPGGNRRLAAWTVNLGGQPVQVVPATNGVLIRPVSEHDRLDDRCLTRTPSGFELRPCEEPRLPTFRSPGRIVFGDECVTVPWAKDTEHTQEIWHRGGKHLLVARPCDEDINPPGSDFPGQNTWRFDPSTRRIHPTAQPAGTPAKCLSMSAQEHAVIRDCDDGFATWWRLTP